MAHFQRFFVMAGFSALIGAGVTLQAEPPDGAAVYARACASCHNGGDSRAPAREVLAQRSPEAIMSALTAGLMRPQGARIDGLERRAVAEFLSGKTLGGDVTGATVGRCTAQPPFPGSASLPSWTSWGGSITNTRFQPPDQAELTADQVPHLALKWAFGFPDATSAWSQPTIFGGRVFVGSHNGTVYALDAKQDAFIGPIAPRAACVARYPSAREMARVGMPLISATPPPTLTW
jgi:polyvinyl alcohol dehydrogenase (cytochrome)